MRGALPAGTRERRREKRVDDLTPEAGELLSILDTMVAALGGRGFMLSCHPAEGAAGWIVEMTPAIQAGGQGQHALEWAAEFAHDATDSNSLWCEGGPETGANTLLIPVIRVPTHDPLVITVFFDGLTPAQMREAEEAYRRHALFVNGFFKLWQRERALGQHIRALEVATDQIGTGLILLNRGGDIIFTNAVASKILDGADGLRRIRRSIGASRMSEDVTLQVALNHVIAANGADAQAADTAPAPVVALTRRSGSPLIALLLTAPLTAAGKTEVAAAVYVNDPELDVAAMIAPVCRLYRLSPVEVQLATLLAKGIPLVEAAKEMHVRELTARTYLKQIFLKTNTNRQTELVVLMLSSILRMRPPVINNIQPLKTDAASLLGNGQSGSNYVSRNS